MGLKYRPKAARPEAAVRCSSNPSHRKAALLISFIVSFGFSYFCYRLDHSGKQLCLSVMVRNGQGAITTAVPTQPGEVRSQSGPLVLLESRAVGCGLRGHEVTWVSFQPELKLRKMRTRFLSWASAHRLHTSLIAEGRGGEGHTISSDQRGTQGILNPKAG